MTYKLYATCPNEMTPLLAEEIRKLGGTEVNESYRVVYFDATEEVYYKAHLQLRLASRVCRILKEVPAQSPTIIFDKLKKIRYHEYFSNKQALKINVIVSDQNGKVEGHLIGSKIREAVTDSFKHFKGEDANLSAREANIVLSGFYHNNRLMLSIDTSLKSLHKRGYRVEGHPAPLKETLASALLMACEYDGKTTLLDPMCGSGSIIIEGAQIAINKAPLIHRKKGEFGFEFLEDFNSNMWRKVQDDARKAQIDSPAPLFASDISQEYLDIASQAALKARVEKYITFTQGDFFESEKPTEKGLMITNIPYGMRLDEEAIDVDYIKKIGQHLRDNYTGWKIGLLVPEECPYKQLGLKVSKKINFLNGMVPVKFLIFDIF